MKKVSVNLKVSATRQGKPLAVDVFVLAADSGQTLANRASSDKEPAAFHLEPGSYKLRIVDAWGQEGRPEQTVDQVEVAADQVKEVTVNFGGGVLEVEALKKGKRFSADVCVIDAQGGENYQQTYEDRPARFELPSGEYKVRVKDEWGSGAIQDLGKIKIGSETVKKQVSFNTGTIEVWAYKNGKPYVVDVFVLDGGGEQLTNFQTREDQAAKADLLPGRYTLRIKDEWGEGSVRETQITIEPDKTLVKKEEF